jgi:hypothetical protein
MVPRSFALALTVLCAPVIACGGSSKPYYIPASSPVKPFEPPEREDLLSEDDDLDDWSETVSDDDDGDDGADPVEASDTGGGTADAGMVGAGDATVHGGLDKDVIRGVIRQRLPQFRACYESELLRDPQLAGTVTVEFVINAAGKVTKASAGGMIEPVARCVSAVIQRIEFPKPQGGGTVKVSYPFRFQVQS